MWPDCSPPSDRPRFSISSITYLSPTGAAHQLDARLAQRELEADVAHHGRDDRVALAAGPSRCSWRAHISSTASPSTIAAAVVDEDRAIAVAVERDAHVAAALDDGPREPLGMRRAAVEVDVAAVRLVADDDGLEAEAANSRGATVRRRAVGAVDGELETARARDASGSTARR